MSINNTCKKKPLSLRPRPTPGACTPSVHHYAGSKTYPTPVNSPRSSFHYPILASNFRINSLGQKFTHPDVLLQKTIKKRKHFSRMRTTRLPRVEGVGGMPSLGGGGLSLGGNAILGKGVLSWGVHRK